MHNVDTAVTTDGHPVADITVELLKLCRNQVKHCHSLWRTDTVSDTTLATTCHHSVLISATKQPDYSSFSDRYVCHCCRLNQLVLTAVPIAKDKAEGEKKQREFSHCFSHGGHMCSTERLAYKDLPLNILQISCTSQSLHDCWPSFNESRESTWMNKGDSLEGNATIWP